MLMSGSANLDSEPKTPVHVWLKCQACNRCSQQWPDVGESFWATKLEGETAMSQVTHSILQAAVQEIISLCRHMALTSLHLENHNLQSQLAQHRSPATATPLHHVAEAPVAGGPSRADVGVQTVTAELHSNPLSRTDFPVVTSTWKRVGSEKAEKNLRDKVLLQAANSSKAMSENQNAGAPTRTTMMHCPRTAVTSIKATCRLACLGSAAQA